MQNSPSQPLLAGDVFLWSTSLARTRGSLSLSFGFSRHLGDGSSARLPAACQTAASQHNETRTGPRRPDAWRSKNPIPNRFEKCVCPSRCCAVTPASCAARFQVPVAASCCAECDTGAPRTQLQNLASLPTAAYQLYAASSLGQQHVPPPPFHVHAPITKLHPMLTSAPSRSWSQASRFPKRSSSVPAIRLRLCNSATLRSYSRFQDFLVFPYLSQHPSTAPGSSTRWLSLRLPIRPETKPYPLNLARPALIPSTTVTSLPENAAAPR